MRGHGVERGGTFDEGWTHPGRPVPDGARRVGVEVSDPAGLSCESGLWIVRAFYRLDASVWISCEDSGTLQLTERGRGTVGRRQAWARFYRGATVNVYADGPDADEALAVASEMVALTPSERKGFYRSGFSGRPTAGTGPKACEVCEDPDRDAIDAELSRGRSPRSLRSDYPGHTRAAITAHRDGCGRK